MKELQETAEDDVILGVEMRNKDPDDMLNTSITMEEEPKTLRSMKTRKLAGRMV